MSKAMNDKWKRVFNNCYRDLSKVPVVVQWLISNYRQSEAVQLQELDYPVLITHGMGRDFTYKEWLDAIMWLKEQSINGVYLGVQMRVIDVYNLKSAGAKFGGLDKLKVPSCFGGYEDMPLLGLTF